MQDRALGRARVSDQARRWAREAFDSNVPDGSMAAPGSRWEKQLGQEIAVEVLRRRRNILKKRKATTDHSDFATRASLEDQKLHNATPPRMMRCRGRRDTSRNICR